MAPLDLGRDGGVQLMESVIGAMETFEPNVVRSGVCSYLVARRMHEDGFRVGLCGEGADELFAGYIPLERAFLGSEDVGRSVRDQCLTGMHRSNLQRVDRCAMRFQIEMREPFLDPAVANYAMELAGSDLVHSLRGLPRGKMPLRRLYDLYPDDLPVEIRDRTKVPFNEGAGLDDSQTSSPWRTLAEALISDRDLQEGVREYAAFDLRDKEDLLYLRMLARSMDVRRAPHLQSRSRLAVPQAFDLRGMEQFIV